MSRIGRIDRRCPAEAGIIHDDIDLAEAIVDAANTFVDTLLIAHVHGDGERALLREIFNRRTRAQRDARAFLIQFLGDRAADAPARAGYNGNLIDEHQWKSSINHGFGKAYWTSGCARVGATRR